MFHVTPGKRCRFRVIGATCDNCPVRLSVESHRLTLIATDGNSIKPITVDYVEISSGIYFLHINPLLPELRKYIFKIFFDVILFRMGRKIYDFSQNL